MEKLHRIIQKILMLVIILFIGSQIFPMNQKVKDLAWSDGWYYIENDERIDVTLPAEIKHDGELVLMHDINSSYSEEMMSAKLAKYDISILVNDNVLYEYNDDAFPRNDQMKSKINCEADLPTVIDDGVVKLVLEDTNNGVFDIDDVYLGTKKELLGFEFLNSIPMIAISVTMIAFAVCAVFVYLSLKVVSIRDDRLLNTAAFLFATTIWEVFDSSFAQSFSNYSAIFYTLSFLCFMLMGVPFIRFVHGSKELKDNKVFPILVSLFYLNAGVQCLLRYLNVFQFIDMLFVTHVLLFGSAIYIVFVLIKTYRKTKSENIGSLLIGVGLLSFSGILSLILYWLYDFSQYTYLFEIGIVLFGVNLIRTAFRLGLENSKAKTEMLIYKRLAKKDFLTGLENRLSFEDYIVDLMSRIDQLDNVLLMYLDVNHLKKVNDRFGHNVGDELIIASSDCIYQSYGQIGKCYRIGGDEFCVIIENPEDSIEKLKEELDKNINKFNQQKEKYTLSIAVGGSLLKDEGIVKTISDWKYEADKNMYKDKGASNYDI